jgi:hypothetical protein
VNIPLDKRGYVKHGDRIEDVITKTLENPDLPLSERMRLIELLAQLTLNRRQNSHEAFIERIKKKPVEKRTAVEQRVITTEERREPEAPLGARVDAILAEMKKTETTEVKDDGQDRQ